MNIRRILTAALLVACALGSVAAQRVRAQMDSYDDVMLVINEKSWASREIGAFFAARRNIPARNIYRMTADTAETIDSARFVELRWKMQAWMEQNGLSDAVNYIVTTKGCPLRVRTSQWDRFDSLGRLVSLGGQASFEDCLALMNGEDSTLALSVKFSFPYNRYYNSTRRFARDPETLPIYLVTRLDAYSVDQVKGYIVKADSPATIGDGLWVLDIDPSKEGNAGYRVGNDWLRGARDTLTSRGMTIEFNNDTAYLRQRQGVVGYASWGSNDAHSGGRDGAVPRNTWLNGAIAETYVSTGGRTFNEGSTGGQSLIADWIAEGASGVKGYTDEPYLSAIAHPDILFDRYTSGFNMAESFWAASQFSAWRQVVIGDPKMKLATILRATEQEVDFGMATRGATELDTVRFSNVLAVPVVVTGITFGGENPDDFSAATPGRTLPATIAPGGTFDVVVALRAIGYGARSAALVIAHRREGDDRDNALVVRLAGTVQQPSLLAPTSYDFGPVPNETTVEHVMELGTSLPDDTLRITTFSKAGPAAARFEVTPLTELPARLTGDATLGVRIAYSPSGATRDSTTLTVYTANGGAPVRIKLYGSGATSDVRTERRARTRNLVVSPNPVAARSEIRFELESAARVRIEILDLRGSSVRVVADGPMGRGEQRVALDVSELASGSYLCRVEIVEPDGTSRTHVEQVIRR